MTSTNRNRLLVLGLAVVIIGMIVLFTVFGGGDKTPAVETVPPIITEDGLGVSGDIEPPTVPAGLSPEPKSVPVIEGRTASLQMAELFSARYGSYSNQGSYQNLRDLLPIMTTALQVETKKFLASVSSSAPAVSYEGYTSKKISTKEVSYNDSSGTAEYEVTLQQLKVTDVSEPEITYPVLRVKMQKVGDNWKVSSAEWIR